MTEFPPSWSQQSDVPGRAAGDVCRMCGGRTWWTEAHKPAGWRCHTCHPPDHLPADRVTRIEAPITPDDQTAKTVTAGGVTP